MRELKQTDKGARKHYPQISELYKSVCLTPNIPNGLLNRVQMNVRLLFCIRANENFENMKRKAVGEYQNGTR